VSENNGQTSYHLDDHLHQEQTKHTNSDSDDIENCDVVFSTDSDDDSNDDPQKLREALKDWVNTYEIRANSVDSLLKLLKDNGHPDLPMSSRTLLKTPRDVDLQRVSDMDYFHFGLQTMICNALRNYSDELLEATDTLVLSLNIDGLPLFKSSQCSAWPILGVICNLRPCRPFLITLTVGYGKPSNLDFIHEAITELNFLLANGLQFCGKKFKIDLKCIVCDAPARAFVKCTKLYSGYYGCDKCTQQGNFKGRMTYPLVDNVICRTDQSFRNGSQPEHHKARSPFENLPIDMIKQFPIDYMHQVCLGVTKKLILMWMRGKRRNTKLSAGQVEQISLNMLSLKRFIPQEFARKPRSLSEVDRWKATEFRQFLLYTGQFALKDILPDPLYQHFMCLSVSINILVSENLSERHKDYAGQLLKYFVEQCKDLYGDEFLVYNVHSLIHLKDDVEEYQSLDNCAAWVFENYMQQLKKKVRSGTNPAAQLVKRVLESMDAGGKNRTKQYKIACKKPNNAYNMNNGKYCYVVQRLDPENKYLCRVYHTPTNLFHFPCNSSLIGFVKFQHLNYEMKAIDAQKLTTRCVKLQIEQDNFVAFLPLQHSL
jgi:hypothetical protein